LKIFLSFASEQSRIAESIYRKLLAQGYKVFFASDEIRASDHYDDVIRREIKSAGRLVFLASPESLTEGRYTLTELRMFSRKWPDATNRVMTVMLDDIGYDELPPYLSAVPSALDPSGDVPSEVASEVLDRWPVRKWPVRLAGAAVIGLAAGIAWWANSVWDGSGSPVVQVEDDPQYEHWLQLSELECVDATGESEGGTDEPKIEVNGKKVWDGTSRCNTNERQALGVDPILLNEDGNTIELIEKDVFADDHLGTHVISLQPGPGSHTFEGKTGGESFKFIVTWSIDAVEVESD